MSLTFPNDSRTYDPMRRRIRFSGYDGMFEIQFFLELDALARAAPDRLSGEAGYLKAFDMVRPTINAAAARVYGKGRGGNLHTLRLADFY